MASLRRNIFANLAGGRLDPAAIKQISETVAKLDRLDSTNALTGLLGASKQ